MLLAQRRGAAETHALHAFGHSFSVSRVSAFLRAAPTDDHGENWDAMWYIHYAQAKWWNPVPMRHGAGTVAAFADAHSEFHPWKDPRTIVYAKMTWAESEAQRTSAPAQDGNEDLRWAQTAIWGKLGYTFQP
jgi:hypothetical protein